MKIAIKGNTSKSSLQPLEVYQYSLDSSSVATALIAETLRKSYKYPIQTLIQEYLSNARDAHREAGIKKAIQVQFPTTLNPEMFIRDFGGGIAPDKIVSYITFAFSTKRSDDNLTGGFGYGSKSAFAYADSFSIISFYKGVQYTYRASVSENKEGSLVLLAKKETQEPDGLKIQIAVRPEDRDLFVEAILRLKNFWISQEIEVLNASEQNADSLLKYKLVNKIKNVKIWEHNFKRMEDHSVNRWRLFHEKMFNKSGSGVSNVFLLIDEIPYPIDNIRLNSDNLAFVKNLRHKIELSISIPTGKVQISKYREYIEDTPSNTKYLNELLKIAKNDMEDSFSKMFPIPYKNISELQTDQFKEKIKTVFSCMSEVNIEILIGDEIFKTKVSDLCNLKLEFHYGSKIEELRICQYYVVLNGNSPRINICPHSNQMIYQSSVTVECQKISNIKYFEDSLSKNKFEEILISSESDENSYITYFRSKTFFDKKTLDFFKFFNVECMNEFPINKSLLAKYQPVIDNFLKQSKSFKQERTAFYYHEMQGLYSFHTSKTERSVVPVYDTCLDYDQNNINTLKNNKLLILDKKRRKINISLYRFYMAMGFQIMVVNQDNYNILIKSPNAYDFFDVVDKKIKMNDEQTENVKKIIDDMYANEHMHRYIKSYIKDIFEIAPDEFTPQEKVQLSMMNGIVKDFHSRPHSPENQKYLYPEDIGFVIEKCLCDELIKINQQSKNKFTEFNEILLTYDFLTLLSTSKNLKNKLPIIKKIIANMRKP